MIGLLTSPEGTLVVILVLARNSPNILTNTKQVCIPAINLGIEAVTLVGNREILK